MKLCVVQFSHRVTSQTLPLYTHTHQILKNYALLWINKLLQTFKICILFQEHPPDKLIAPEKMEVEEDKEEEMEVEETILCNICVIYVFV